MNDWGESRLLSIPLGEKFSYLKNPMPPKRGEHATRDWPKKKRRERKKTRRAIWQENKMSQGQVQSVEKKKKRKSRKASRALEAEI